MGPCVLLAWLIAAPFSTAEEPIELKRQDVVVRLDVSQVPDLKDWGVDAAHLILEWHPRICNLLPTKGITPPREITLRIVQSNEGVAATSGNVITVSSHWIEKHPEDIGLTIHELVHVIQGYPNADSWWITEGIADYIRRVVYEGQPRRFFPIPQKDQGYQQGYNTAAGFLFWLETERAPGIVNRLNTALRTGTYDESLFQEQTKQSLDELWADYRQTARP